MQGPGDEEGLRPTRHGKKKVAATNSPWTGWRGSGRDGRVAWLPERLPARPKVLWRVRLPSKGLGGVAATSERVLISARELNDSTDAWTCLRASDGKELWKVVNPAVAELDYGNSPRATPLLHDGLVYLAGATGLLTCVELSSGKTVWEMDLREEFGARDERKWGFSSSPLLAGGRIIINPGGKDASLVALEPRSGKVVWKTPGKPAGYGNLISARLGGREQLVGFDSEALNGWDVKTGERLWRLPPRKRSDFHVPTPIVWGERLVVAWENNGTLLYNFTRGGQIDPSPVAQYPKLAPDTHTPVVTAGRVFGVWNGLHALDLTRNLEPVWLRREASFGKYATLVASDDRVLAITMAGELVLFEARGTAFKPVSRVQLLVDEAGVYSHPALVGTRLYLRGDSELLCVELAE